MLCGLHESSLRFRHNSGSLLQIADCRIGILARRLAIIMHAMLRDGTEFSSA